MSEVRDPTVVSNGGRDTDGSARMLSRWTFDYTPAQRIVREYLGGKVLNACACETWLTTSEMSEPHDC